MIKFKKDKTILNTGIRYINARVRRYERWYYNKKNIDLTRIEVNYLYWIYQNRDLEIGDILVFLDINKSTFSNLVSKLISKGYLEKNRSSDDKRRVELVVTEQGLEIVGHARQVRVDIYDFIEGKIGKQKLKDFTDIGLEIVKALDDFGFKNTKQKIWKKHINL